MNPRVTNVKTETDYTLHLWITNGEEGILDMKPYLNLSLKNLVNVNVEILLLI